MRPTVDDPAARFVARVDALTLHRSFVHGFSEACREGLPVVHLSGHAMTGSGPTTAIVSTRELEVLRLRSDLESATQRTASAKEAYLSEPQDSPVYRQLLEGWKAELHRRTAIQERLDAITREPVRSAAAVSKMRADVEVIAKVMSRLASPEVAYTQAEVAAFSVVVPVFELSRDASGAWFGTAVVRLPVEEGVVELGPFTWPVNAIDTPGAAAVEQLGPDAPRPAVDSRTGMAQALAQQGVPMWAVYAIGNAPFPQLSTVMLTRHDPDALAQLVGPRWAAPDFVAHLAAVYTGEAAWGGPTYLADSPFRQALAELTAEYGGEMTLAQLKDHAPWVTRSYLQEFSQPHSTRVEPWYPPVTITRREDGELVARSVMCRCGQFATLAVRVREVPGDLLCACGLAPRARGLGVPDVVFPPEYQALTIARPVWERKIKTNARVKTGDAPRPARPGSDSLNQVLRAMQPGEALTVRRAAEGANLSAVTTRRALITLCERGMVERVEGRPHRWRRIEVTS